MSASGRGHGAGLKVEELNKTGGKGCVQLHKEGENVDTNLQDLIMNYRTQQTGE